MFKNQNLNYSWSKLGGDLCGGAIAALIALPYGLALASAMGLPPVMGLYVIFVRASDRHFGKQPCLDWRHGQRHGSLYRRCRKSARA